MASEKVSLLFKKLRVKNQTNHSQKIHYFSNIFFVLYRSIVAGCNCCFNLTQWIFFLLLNPRMNKQKIL